MKERDLSQLLAHLQHPVEPNISRAELLERTAEDQIDLKALALELRNAWREINRVTTTCNNAFADLNDYMAERSP
ncbi:MAG: hypothetical protein V3S68_04800 [Dehalococcoidia bacterium]